MNKTNIGLVILGVIAGVLIGMKTQVYQGNMVMDHGAMSMQDMMLLMSANLSGKSGDEFDKAFLEEMITHHEGAVLMAEAAVKNAKHEEIKDLAAAIIKSQSKEIHDMEEWQKVWYGAAPFVPVAPLPEPYQR